MKEFESVFEIKDNDLILDVGGNQFNWKFIKAKPKVIILNLQKPNDWTESEQFEFVRGDATNLHYPDKSFDIVYPNSVIEHLFTKANQMKMANEILRVGKKVYVQTPAKEFFVEPHLITPFIHWMPIKIQEKLMKNFTLWGLIARPTKEYIKNFLKERRLLTKKEFAQLFPDCEIKVERFLFMPKSYIAIKT
ncbi:MAG: hypothetical protein Fur0028_02120 [Bacteroidales bacterium]